MPSTWRTDYPFTGAMSLLTPYPHRLPLALVWAMTAATFAACLGGGQDTGGLRRQADDALARWADAVAAAGDPAVFAIGELTGQVGNWEAEVGDNNKRALMSGLVELLAETLPPVGAADGEVVWPDGTTARMPLIPAEEAIEAIRAGSSEPCEGCEPLRITGARLTTGPIETNRGSATAPLWEFELDGTAVTVTHVAVANRVRVVPPAWDANDPPTGVWIQLARGSMTARELTVEFVGAPLPADQSCGEDYSTQTVESDLAVVVIVLRHPAVTSGGCLGVGALRTAVAELAAPLGDRAVLQVYDGSPVRVVLRP